MATSNEASRVSCRIRTTEVSSMAMSRSALLDPDLALGGLGVELTEEGILAGRQRADEDHRLAVAADDLFAVQLVALEFFRRRVEVLDQQLDLGVGRDHDFRREEQVVANLDFDDRGRGEG